MRALYEIDSDIVDIVDSIYQCVDEETGEISDEEQVERLNDLLGRLQAERDKKIENVALYVKELDAEAKALKSEEETLRNRRKRKEAGITALKAWLGNALDGAKFETTRTAVSFRKSTSVRILDESAIPPEYVKVKEERTVDKVGIKKALQGGLTVAGAELETKQNVAVK